MKWQKDPSLLVRLFKLIKLLEFSHVSSSGVFAYRSYESSARAYARIWSFPKIFQEVLDVEPAYVIEVLSEKFDKLSEDNKTKVLIHELLHIPKNFSGSLLPHKSHGRTINREVDKLYKMFKQRKKP